MAELILADDHPRKPYRSRPDGEKYGQHRGQRKLFLVELLFFRQHVPPGAIVVYAGAAPGHHLAELVPLLGARIAEWHLYDPAEFHAPLHGLPSVHTYRQLFTDETAQLWAGRNDVAFVSDIRTADHRRMSQPETEAAVDLDMRSQERWYRIMRPAHCLLKFRPPYAYPGTPNEYRYLAGTLYKQPYAPLSSSECRLAIDGPDAPERTYDAEKYGDQMFYHNDVLRKAGFDRKADRWISSRPDEKNAT